MQTEINLGNFFLRRKDIGDNFGGQDKNDAKAIKDVIDTKVDKDGNKVLSTYDFNATYKNALDGLGQTIANAVGNLDIVEVVGNNLPTSNIKTNKLYLKNNGSSSSENKYDVYIRVNNEWEKIDSLGFDISQYLTKSEAQNTYQPQGNYLTSVANGNITNGAVTLAKLNSDVYDTTNGGTSSSSNKLITSNAVFNGLSGKESTSNKVTSISSSSTDTQYPSAKAVKTYVDNIIGTIDNWLVQ